MPGSLGKGTNEAKRDDSCQKEGVKPRRLLESDYLLGVYDQSRMGGLRFKTEAQGDFLSDDELLATHRGLLCENWNRRLLPSKRTIAVWRRSG